MKVAAYQAPLLPAGSMAALDLIRGRVAWCETEGVAILCCPEAILGGLADDDADPRRFAIPTNRIDSVLAPLASDAVTSIVGLTEVASDGRLFNTAAVCQHGAVVGLYRKQHPAIRRSVYAAGTESPVFTAGPLTLGIVICNDSNFAEPARVMAARGAAALFIPSNNGLPPAKGGAALVDDARRVDVATATANRLWVVRADVAGRSGSLTSHGCSAIVDPGGRVVASARELSEDVIVAEID
jgi:predicted amidohydrolase